MSTPCLSSLHMSTLCWVPYTRQSPVRVFYAHIRPAEVSYASQRPAGVPDTCLALLKLPLHGYALLLAAVHLRAAPRTPKDTGVPFVSQRLAGVSYTCLRPAEAPNTHQRPAGVPYACQRALPGQHCYCPGYVSTICLSSLHTSLTCWSCLCTPTSC